MSTWYFVDRGQNRQGPVDADTLVEALRQGRVDFNSLVWREGLAQWVPLGQFIAELNLPVPNLAPGAAVSTPGPAEKKTGCGVIAIVAVGVGVVLIAVLGILAAIALPAYQDYIVRSKVTAAHFEAQAARFAVDEFVLNTDRCPRDAAELQLAPASTPGVASLEIGEANTGMCTIEVEMAGDFGGGRLAGERLRHSRDSAGDWYCTSDSIPDKYLPVDCQ